MCFAVHGKRGVISVRLLGRFGLSCDSEARQISFKERLHQRCHVERRCETAFCEAPCIYGGRRLFSA